MYISITDGNRRITRITELKSRQSSKHLRDNRCRIHTDYGTSVHWLHAHLPFSYSDLDSLVDISTGIVADKTVIIAMQRTTLVLSQLLPWLARTSQT